MIIMKHLKKGRKFGREKKQRKALIKTMAGSLFLQRRIKTTEAKAREIRIFAENVCKIIKKFFPAEKRKTPESLAAMRNLLSLFPKNIGQKTLFEIFDILPEKESGFTRVVKIGSRRSDGAKMAIVEIIEKEAKKS